MESMIDTSSLLAGSPVGIASVAVLGLLLFLRSQRPKDNKQDGEDGTYVELTEYESGLLAMGISPISTITWFEGDHEQAALALKERIGCIIDANPWLGGRILKRQGKHYIFYSSVFTPSLDTVFLCVKPEDSPINRDLSFDDMGTACENTSSEWSLLLKRKRDYQQPFWKVSVVPCSKSPSTQFALIVSMSHIVGDGHTFYSLHNMLVGGKPVGALEAARIVRTQEQREEAMGKAEIRSIHSVGFICTFMRGLFVSKVIAPFSGGRLQAESRHFLVDKDKINKLKAELSVDSSVPFVSTNDIISSWFLRNCDCQHGFLAVDLRNKIKGHTDVHAGNYSNGMYCRNPADTSSPSLIRLSVQTLKRAVTSNQAYSNREVAAGHFAIITNWASFHSSSVDLMGCRECLHMPIYDYKAHVVPTMALCVIFQVRPDQLAVTLAGTPGKMAGLRDAPFESEQPFF